MNRALYPHPFIAREGRPIIYVALALAVLAQLVWGGLPALLLWLVLLLVTQFFRDPCREPPQDPSLVLSPADGQVIKVVEERCPYTGEPARLISIFMNVFNVHSQKTPLAGRVEKVEYWPGKFGHAALDKSSLENERNAITLVSDHGERVCFVQIAGLLARRVSCSLRIGQRVERGQRCGFIRFGSRVDVYLPPDWECLVSVGDRVTGVSSALARLPESD